MINTDFTNEASRERAECWVNLLFYRGVADWRNWCQTSGGIDNKDCRIKRQFPRIKASNVRK